MAAESGVQRLPESVVSGYRDVFMLLKWVALALMAQLIFLVWVVIAGVGYGVGELISQPVGIVTGILTFLLVPVIWGWYRH